MLIEASSPLTVRLPSGEIHLTPGQPVELPDEQAKRLLEKVPGKVRAVSSPEPITIEPASPNAKPVYWERADGRIYGPARVTDLAKVGTGATEQFWVIVEYQGQPSWLRSDRLRSKRAFEQQVEAKACQCCHTFRFWESVHGAVVYGTCHPPADSALVIRWLNGKQ